MLKGQAGMALAVIIVAILFVEPPKDADQGNILPHVRPFGMTAIAVVMAVGAFLVNKFNGGDDDSVRAYEIDIPQPSYEGNQVPDDPDDEIVKGVSTHEGFYRKQPTANENEAVTP